MSKIPESYLSCGDVNDFMEHSPDHRLAARRSRHAAMVTVVVVEVNRKYGQQRHWPQCHLVICDS